MPLDPKLLNSIQQTLSKLMSGSVTAQPAGNIDAGGAGEALGKKHPIYVVMEETKKLPGEGGDIGKLLRESLERLAKGQLLTRALGGDKTGMDFFQREHDRLQAKARAEKEAAEEAKRKKEYEDRQKERSKERSGGWAGLGSSTGYSGGPSNPDMAANRSILQGVQSIGAIIGGPFGAAVGAVGKFGEAMFKSVDMVNKWNMALRVADFQFAEFSGKMAQVQMEAQVREIQLNRERGDRRADSARQREEAYSRFQRIVAPIEDSIAIIRNQIVARITDTAGSAIAGLRAFLTGRLEIPGPGGGGGEEVGGWLQVEGEEGWSETYGRPGWR